MSKTSWRALSALALGACAIAALSHGTLNEESQAGQMSLPETRQSPTSAGSAMPVPSNSVPTVGTVSTDGVVDVYDDADPFAPRGWQAEAIPIPVTAAPVVMPLVIPPNEAPPAPTAPALPFTFMGRMSDGVVAMVYLSRGEESWTVKGGETLDGNYRVVSVNPQQIVFEYVPTGTQQTLALPEPEK